MKKPTRPRKVVSSMPGFIEPQLATLKTKAPAGEDWIHEIKYDGYRIQLHIDGDTRKAFTRNGHDWIKRFSVIAGAFDLPYQAIIDGEVVVVHEGRTNFSELQAELAGENRDLAGGGARTKSPQLVRPSVGDPQSPIDKPAYAPGG